MYVSATSEKFLSKPYFLFLFFNIFFFKTAPTRSRRREGIPRCSFDNLGNC